MVVVAVVVAGEEDYHYDQVMTQEYYVEKDYERNQVKC